MGDQLSGRQYGFKVRSVCRQPVQLGERDAPPARGTTGGFDRGVERDQCLREVTGVRGNAAVARAKHRVGAVDALERRATRARRALVACEAAAAEVLATRALQNGAAERGPVADLAAGSQRQGLLYEGIAGPHHRMVL